MFKRSRLPRANALLKLIAGFAGVLLVLSARAVMAAPPAPADIYGSGVDSTQVTLTWLPSSGATSYNIGRSTTQGGPYTTVATGIASTSYTNTGLSNNGTKYYFIVTATNSTGTSGNSGELWVTTPNPSNTSAISATATVNWATSAGAATPTLYGTNDIAMAFQSQTCSSTQDAAYISNLTQMGTTSYRLLSSGLSGYVTCDGGAYSGWTDTNQTWDTVLPPREFAQPYLQGATTIMNIPSTPPWMAPNATVAPNTYANFCAQLVTQVKGMPYSHPTYWEPMNEWWCVTGPTMTQIDNIFNACSSAMRAADPTIKMAGPVTCYLDTGIMTTFLQNCGANVDCVTWHHYPSCAATDSTDTVMNNTPTYASDTTTVRGLINTYCPNPSAVKIAVDEYSIPCAWDEGETRQDSNVGATYFASVLKNLAYGGCDIGAQWGAKDGIYGVMSLDDAVQYPGATVYKWANRYLVGTLYSTSSTNSMVEVMAIKKPDNSQTVLLINKASGTATVTLNLGLGSSSVNVGSIDSGGVHDIAPATLGSSVTMPPCSVKIIQLPATGTTGLVSLNCGGPAASPFIADADFGAGNAATNWTGAIDTSAVTSAAPQAVYQSERYGTNTYVIPGLTANAGYTVRLHFCENYFTVSGQRKFNVIINGTQVLTNFDIFATAGAIHKANIQQFSATADSSGQITIIFATTLNNALVNGIQITAATPSVPTGLTATAGNSQVALSWNASTGATAYDVKRSTVSGSGYATVSSPATTNYTNTGLTNGTAYYFVVDAKNASGASANSTQSSATPHATTLPIQINAAGPAVSPFVADIDFSGGLTATNWTGAIDTSGVTSPAPQTVYQSERYGASTYTIPGLTANANYTVRLHFCENFFTATGQRVFNVTVNSTSVLSNFDIYAKTGAAHKANIQQFSAAANGNGQIVVAFTNVTDNALVNGIEVVAASGPSNKINSGGPAVSPFVADVDFSGGATATNWTGAIDTSAVTSPAPQTVYQSERYSNPAMTYTIPGYAASSLHTVRLHFCENFFTASGQRVFSVAVNGTTVLTNFDIYAKTGAAHKANIQEFNVAANSSGQYVIAFTNVTNSALLNGIEVN